MARWRSSVVLCDSIRFYDKILHCTLQNANGNNGPDTSRSGSERGKRRNYQSHRRGGGWIPSNSIEAVRRQAGGGVPRQQHDDQAATAVGKVGPVTFAKGRKNSKRTGFIVNMTSIFIQLQVFSNVLHLLLKCIDLVYNFPNM